MFDSAPAVAQRPVRRGWRRIIVIFLVLALAGAGAWFGWLRPESVEHREIVVFRADPTPFRKTPENPGIADIPNTGILVLENTGSTNDEEGLEVLMPPPEEPLVLAAPVPGGTDGGIVDVAEAPLARVNEATEPEPIFDAEQVSAIVDEALARNTPEVPPVPAEKPDPPDVAWHTVPGASQDASSGQTLSFSDVAASLGGEDIIVDEGGVVGRYRAQIASYSDRGSATTHWDRLYHEHNDLFRGMEALIIETVISDTHYFRLYIGDYATKSEAETLCAALNERTVDCLVASF